MQAAVDKTTKVPLWQRFALKAESLGATVCYADREAAAADLPMQAASSPVVTTRLVSRFPHVAARCGGHVVSRESLAPDVVAVGAFAIAETGSVAVADSAGDRGGCFLADHLWVLIPADHVFFTLEAALERMREMIRDGNRYLTLMSGPSRTSDIERTLTIGVHGPRALTVIVVREEDVSA